MQDNLQTKIKKYRSGHIKRKRWQKFIFALSSVTVFCTVYALILPALTAEQMAYCGYEEHIEHTETCYSENKRLTCELSENVHSHSSGCYEVQPKLICNLQETEGHTHGAGCYEERSKLTCGMGENDGHVHSSACLNEAGEYICGLTEGEDAHRHDDGCYSVVSVLVCEKPESSPHHHDESCYTEERELICGLEDAKPHQHGDSCYETTEKTLICDKPIHKHTLQCFSNPDDVETSSIWESGFQDVSLSGNWSEDVISIAATQLGYTESTRNYQVQDDGVTMKGYTRYGDWYGMPYGDWCAMFCSFCLNYANVDRTRFPLDCSCANWIDQLSTQQLNLFHVSGTYTPKPGDLVFFDFDPYHEESERKADHIGFVAELFYNEETNSPYRFRTIEGNWGDAVSSNFYSMDDDYILGYGELPSNPNKIVEKRAVLENGVVVTISAPGSSFPYPEDRFELSATLVTDDGPEELFNSCLNEEGIGFSDAMLIDVCLTYNGEEFEPIGPVTLTFDTGAAIYASAVYHLDEVNETVTDMNADISGDSLATIETDHFSIFVLTEASAKRVSADIDAVWDQTARQFSSITVTATSPDLDKAFYALSSNSGTDWTVPTSSSDWSTMTAKNAVASVPTSLLVGASPDTEYRVHGALNISQPLKNYGYSTSFTMIDLCEKEKAGFKDWLRDNYVQFFGGTAQPQNLSGLYQAFALYNSLPSLTVDESLNGKQWILTANTDFSGSPTYRWEYYDDVSGNWIVMSGETAETLNASEHPVLNGGKNIRCSLYDQQVLKAVTVVEKVDPEQQIRDYVIDQINSELHLNEFPVLVGGNTVKTGTPSYGYDTVIVDVSIHGEKYDNYFFWGNLAADPDAGFADGDSFADYLVSEYLRFDDPNSGLARVSSIWNRYIYDIYDPLSDSGYMNDNSGKYLLNKNADGRHDYGDGTITNVKDSTSTSFHNTLNCPAEVDYLNYDYLENGIDYDNFVTDLEKSVTAVAAGDANAERKYLIDITADAQSKAAAPVAMIVQIQTSWQMFDLKHANAALNEGDMTNPGASSFNTELANLYAIKQALLDFVDYMENSYPGNNLVLGISEVRHDKAQTMLLGTDSNQKTLYVSNNYDILRNSLLGWDTFGNCEHVHYTDGVLKATALNLSSNLEHWEDQTGAPIKYDDIRKIAVVIGGPTENSSSDNGYGCILPWQSFRDAELNAVYGIRANNGTPIGGAPVISWIDNAATTQALLSGMERDQRSQIST